MRADMGKCIIERPRRGSSMPSVKVRHVGRFVIRDGELDYEGLTRIPVSQKAAKVFMRDCKDFSDVLGPLHNYLRSQCGRLWDDVYSEIARVIGRSAGWGVGHILKAHLDVATCTYRGVDGNVWICGKHGVHKVGEHYTHFHVEPETGILRESNIQSLRAVLARIRAKDTVTDIIPIEERKEYRQIDGIWYYQEYDEYEYKTFIKLWRGSPRFEHHKFVKVVVKRQLSTRQLKTLKLRNWNSQ